MAEVELRGIVKDYGAVRVVHGVDLTIEDGIFCVFVGPSGCGKSTLLRMIAGLEEISGGDLMIGGTRVNEQRAAERGLAMVFQTYALYPHMSVRQNLAFGLENIRMPKAEIAARVTEAARMLQLEPYLDRRPRALSGGQWCANPRCFCLTNRCRIWMPNCGSACAAKLPACTAVSATR